MKNEGILFHAKHAFMPNRLGYCGPDESIRIQEGIEGGRTDERLVRTLQDFEAAYPFLRLIARSTGRSAFDYSVPEAYWIGNGLLAKVPVPDFYNFSHRELRGKDKRKVREVFRALDGEAPPHHTFYVMSTYALSGAVDGPNLSNEASKKVAELVDNCRVSWGRVTEVGKDELRVEQRPMRFEGRRLALSAPVVKRVRYNPGVKPFGSVRPGDMVSIHWSYACDVLTDRQSRNIAKYTAADLSLVNRLLASKAGPARK